MNEESVEGRVSSVEGRSGTRNLKPETLNQLVMIARISGVRFQISTVQTHR